jgi:N-acetyltransferase 10
VLLLLLLLLLLCRYAPGDPVESWLHNLLCLDAAAHLPKPPAKLPHPDSCELFYVERDTLFSFHKASEAFLQRVSVCFPTIWIWCIYSTR